jgi:hypothetical protein
MVLIIIILIALTEYSVLFNDSWFILGPLTRVSAHPLLYLYDLFILLGDVFVVYIFICSKYSKFIS